MSSETNGYRTLCASFSSFKQKKELGRGKFCIVYLADWIDFPQSAVVVKAYSLKSMPKARVCLVYREARMMQKASIERIPRVCGFHGLFRDRQSICLVMEHCSSGDLLEKLLSEGRAMEERRVVNEVTVPLLITLAAMHNASIVHRDIKLENIFLDVNGQVKLGDFGLAINLNEDKTVRPVGTPNYMAPELFMLEQEGGSGVEVDEKIDIWALGISIYELVTGSSPFDGRSWEEVKRNVLEKRMRECPSKINLSSECLNFIDQVRPLIGRRKWSWKMLCFSARDRPTAKALLRHPWIEKNWRKGESCVGSGATWMEGSASALCPRNFSETYAKPKEAEQQKCMRDVWDLSMDSSDSSDDSL